MVCKKCGKELTQEMIDVNLCWSCGDIINKSVDNQEQETTENDTIANNELDDNTLSVPNSQNGVGVALKILGIILLVLGTIGSFVLADGGGRHYSFVFSAFALYEFATVLASFILIGFAEIINLLHQIVIKIGNR